MRKFKHMYFRIPMELQKFHEGGGTGGGQDGQEGEGGGGGTGKGQEGAEGGDGGGNKPMSFDEFLSSNKDYQAEFDRRVSKAIQTHSEKEAEKRRILEDEKKSEEEKMKALSEAEKAEYQRQKRIKELDDREKELDRREMLATAKAACADAGLPSELAESLAYQDKDSFGKGLEALKGLVAKQVEAQVKEKLKGTQPPKKASEPDELSEQEKVRRYMERGFH
jgi:hypothetical protein